MSHTSGDALSDDPLGPDSAVLPTDVAIRPRMISRKRSAAGAVTWSLRVGAAWSWRFLAVIVALGVVVWLLSFVRGIVFAFLVALLLALLLEPLVRFLRRRLGMGRTWAAAIGLLTGIFVVSALAALALSQLIQQMPQMLSESVEGLNSLVDWVADGPIPVEGEQVRTWVENVQQDLVNLVRDNSGTIASGALTFATSAASIATSGLLILFTLFFFLRDGRQMWLVTLRTMPAQWRSTVNEAGIRGWVTLGSYVTTQLKVAAIDAIGIGLGAFFLGVPMAIPITILVFLASFVPIVGAFVSGAVAVLLALVNNGLTSAIIMLVIVLAVQQIEGNVLQPLLMSHAVSLHPVVVVVAVTGGGMVAGIAGAVFAVPLIAFLNVTIQYLHGHDYYPYLESEQDRPGGPPGSLPKQIRDSYPARPQINPRSEEAKKARKAKKKSKK